MSKLGVPTFLQFLDLLIKAFHLDQDGVGKPNSLGSRGTFHAYLKGRDFDLSDRKLHLLLQRFAQAMLDSDIFPVLSRTLSDATPGGASDALIGFLGEEISIPRPTGNPVKDMAARLAALMNAHESMLTQARSQSAAIRLDPFWGLFPLVRFAGHHIAIALGLLLWVQHIGVESLSIDSPSMTWAEPEPKNTPLRSACEAQGLTRADLLRRLRDSTGGLRVASDNTLDNLWFGGREHASLDTLRAVTEALFAEDAKIVLPTWRRWYGLRSLAWAYVGLWSWEWLGYLLGDIHFVARHVAASLRDCSLSSPERLAFVSDSIWAGWRTYWARWALARFAVQEQLSPIVRPDFNAIGTLDESLRLQHCFQIASGGPAFVHRGIQLGRDPETARREALHFVGVLQSDMPSMEGLDPVFDVEFAKVKRDWPRMEVAARALVRANPSLDETHELLAMALTEQNKFDEAFIAIDQGLTQAPRSPRLLLMRAQTMMSRGHVRGSSDDFSIALRMLESANFAGDYGAHLLVADCAFALSEWAAARSACQRAYELHDECGEAYALESICWLRLGNVKRSKQAGEYANRRGSAKFLAYLRGEDERGALGSAGIAHLPRWHRVRYA